MFALEYRKICDARSQGTSMSGDDLTAGKEKVNASERASYVPTWYTASMVPASARGPLTFDLDVDVCVVGAGLAGLTAAREIARRGWSVVVVEGRRIAWSASGRNDGFVLPGFAASMDRLISRVGLEHAKALWALSEMGLKYVRTTIAEARMPGVAPIAGWLKASKVDNGEEVSATVHRDTLATLAAPAHPPATGLRFGAAALSAVTLLAFASWAAGWAPPILALAALAIAAGRARGVLVPEDQIDVADGAGVAGRRRA